MITLIRLTSDLLMMIGAGLYILFMLHHVWPQAYHALIDWLVGLVAEVRAWLTPPPADEWDNLLSDL